MSIAFVVCFYVGKIVERNFDCAKRIIIVEYKENKGYVMGKWRNRKWLIQV